ncbi:MULTISPECIES: ABC transporter ATP-binding protein/permease [Vogesella]|uniref:ABC transporter ATP-binding protein/permease n=1 Tax=Vogesella indigofera TaxID=45465 RepID=A0A495B3J3_VOGIN|nr:MULTISPECIES: ABC transporter ATP-binding protein/permease [Vogesella]KMJ53279.1 ABC transporter ATP-binding protein [Vogesella sp. EB]MDC7691554.1 ABC transporter ATP-binding protein/permease [Vogesella indigofera]RKQ55541.1 putative ATP-binding cassette transporter [Vogesella indigofera]
MNWSQELLQSAIWLGKATAITLLVSLLLGVALARTTMWGRQFWRLAAPFFTPRISGWKPLLSLGAILLITLAGVRVNVLFSRWYNDMYSALQQLNVKLFWASMLIFGVLAAVHVGRSLLEYYLRQVFAIHWRESLNEYFLGKWLDKQGYYRSQHLAKPADNPDQRIQQDISSFVGSSLSLAMGVIDALVSTFEFTLILWGLSGVFALFGVEIPRGLVFMVYIYVIVATVLAFRIGKPLIRLNFLNEKFGADYRYALVRLREYGENIAFYRGEKVEGTTLRLRFRQVIGNAWDIVHRTLKLSGFNLIVSQTGVIFPFILQAPRFFSKQITLGDMVQTSQAFGQLQSNLSFFRSAYDEFAGFKAVLDRLTGFIDAIHSADQLPTPELTPQSEGLSVRQLSLRTPDGQTLLSQLSFSLSAGQALLIRGPSGSGKTTLLRAIAGLWPHCDGHIQRPPQSEVLFLSQRPYLPLGSLRAALHYPHPASANNERAAEVLRSVQLGHLIDKLDEEADWGRILSLGEQQRLGFGRLLLAAPKVIFLDEATSAMDEGLEEALYRLLRSRLPHATLVSVGHRSTLLIHHQFALTLRSGGEWKLESLSE